MKVKRKKRLALGTSPHSFGYNDRSELSSASLGASPYAYDYDNIGNRKTAQEITEEISYDANNINQYSSITQGETPFVPIFDADGNQSLVQSSTGIWSVSYNAESRPISFTKTEAEQTTIIECGYDYMGRRYMKQVSVNGDITLHQRYLYRGYLQIACVDLTRGGQPALWLSMWDPTELVATRPLAIQKNATWYSYGHDLTKNVTELYHTNGTISTTYDYTPFGVVTATGTEQPYQWSSEYHDTELGLVYYNYRHYNPRDGRWINRDPIAEQGGINLYGFVYNKMIGKNDYLGLKWNKFTESISNGIFSIVETSVNKAGDMLAEILGYKNQAELINQLDKAVGNSKDHRGDWIDVSKDAMNWLRGDALQNTDYAINSDTSLAIKSATQGQELITQFLKKNKMAKKCLEWQKITNVKLPFGLKEFIANLPNGQSHFVGRARGDVSIKNQNNKILATFMVTNATHIKSLLYHIPYTEHLEQKKEGKPMATWKQTYSWTETYCCEV